MFGIKFVEGINFSGVQADTNNCIINEAMATKAGSKRTYRSKKLVGTTMN